MGLFFVLFLLYFIFYLLINAWLTGMEAGIITSKQIGNEHQHFSTPTQRELPFLKIKAIPWHLLPHPVQLFFFFLPKEASAKMKLCWCVLLSSGYIQLMIRNWTEVFLLYIHLPKFSKASPGSIGCHALMTIYYWRKLSTFSLQPIMPEFCINTKRKK